MVVTAVGKDALVTPSRQTSGATKHPLWQKAAPPQQRIIQPQMATVPKLEIPALEKGKHQRADWKYIKWPLSKKKKTIRSL